LEAYHLIKVLAGFYVQMNKDEKNILVTIVFILKTGFLARFWPDSFAEQAGNYIQKLKNKFLKFHHSNFSFHFDMAKFLKISRNKQIDQT